MVISFYTEWSVTKGPTSKPLTTEDTEFHRVEPESVMNTWMIRAIWGAGAVHIGIMAANIPLPRRLLVRERLAGVPGMGGVVGWADRLNVDLDREVRKAVESYTRDVSGLAEGSAALLNRGCPGQSADTSGR